MKHTPGPWNVNFQEKLGPDGYYRYQIIDEDEIILAEGDFDDGILPIDERLKIIKLIIAAPDLLEALKDLVEAKELASKEPQILESMKYRWEKATKAICKAGGENNA